MKILYYAVNGDGQGVLFTSYPIRDDKRKIWIGGMSGTYSSLVMEMEAEELMSLPVLKWSDNPVKLELNIKVC